MTKPRLIDPPAVRAQFYYTSARGKLVVTNVGGEYNAAPVAEDGAGEDDPKFVIPQCWDAVENGGGDGLH